MVGLEQIKEQLAIIGIIILILTPIAWAWASGIENMHNEHPDYKGEDFLGKEKDVDSSKSK
jgi:hypothetical protein